MLSISALARRFALARSTLLHYDRLGLLKPAGRSRSGYRRYGEPQVKRLERICTYRRAGLALATIGRILDAAAPGVVQALEARLADLDREMERLRDQQRLLILLLERPERLPGILDKATWCDLLRASGMTEEAMESWHQDFERTAPDKHQRFLEALGIPKAEAEAMRGRWR